MKGSIKKVLYTGIAATFLFATGYLGFDHSKKWVNNKIQTAISQYEQQDKQWTEQKFETKAPLEQLIKAFDSTYFVINEEYYTTKKGEIVEAFEPGLGSGILLKGGYVLAAKHVVDVAGFENAKHPTYGRVNYHHTEIYISATSGEVMKKYRVEKIISGSEYSKDDMDYTLLKLKDTVDLPFYSDGLNMPDKVELGMQSIAIGFPMGYGKNLRLGNVSQTDSDYGKAYLTYKNNTYPKESGGPFFVVENGNIKLTAITVALLTKGSLIIIDQCFNVNYGLKISSIVEDMEEQLKSGKLDQKTAQEVENFLKLNKH